jgi:hypothetical protein
MEYLAKIRIMNYLHDKSDHYDRANPDGVDLFPVIFSRIRTYPILPVDNLGPANKDSGPGTPHVSFGQQQGEPGDSRLSSASRFG